MKPDERAGMPISRLYRSLQPAANRCHALKDLIERDAFGVEETRLLAQYVADKVGDSGTAGTAETAQKIRRFSTCLNAVTAKAKKGGGKKGPPGRGLCAP